MNTIRVLLALIKADFLERTRRSSFRLTLCLVIYLGYAVNTGQILIKLDGYRGVYNSAWVGSLMAIVITFFLGLTGFFLVKNTIERDEHSGVGQILATTPLTRSQYLLGKWLSNFALLSSLVIILALAAIFMQLIQREAAQIEPWPLIAPLVLLALPMLALVAAFAVFFEAVTWLKGGFGNLVYFGLFICLLMVGVFLPQAPWLDVIGFNLIGSSMRAAARAAIPGYSGTFVLAMISGKPLGTFVWAGIDWTVTLMLYRLMWLGISAGIVWLGSLVFNRFDGQPIGSTWSTCFDTFLSRIVLRGRRSLVSFFSRRPKPQPSEKPLEEELVSVPVEHKVVTLAPLAKDEHFHNNFIRLVGLECLLLVKGLKWYWLAGLAALWLGCTFAPTAALRGMAFMLISIWPVLVWSRMGEREARWQTEPLLFPAAYPLFRLPLAAWTAGVAITAVLESGVLFGRLVFGQPLTLLPWALAVLFIPTLAFTLGASSRSSKTFEVIYPILWYLGPFNPQNGLAVLDFLGVHAQAPVNTAPLSFAGGLVGLLFLAVIACRRRVGA